MTPECIENYINNVRWTFAKTMTKIPHEYTVRWYAPQRDKEFCEFANHIRANGYAKNFFSKTFIYFDVGEYSYWTMGCPIHESIQEAKSNIKDTTYIINRALKKGSR